MKPLEFWFSVGSTYSYLTIMRLPALAAAQGLAVEWRPFSVRAIMIEQDNIPFATKPIKAAYMWRDIARRAECYGFPARTPAPYPLAEFDRANRVAMVGREEGWLEAYVVETYRRWFQEGEPAGAEPNLSESLLAAGQDPARVIARAETDEIGAAYEAATAEARDKSIFGAPSFVVEGELFWGDDRLEDAIAWAKRG